MSGETIVEARDVSKRYALERGVFGGVRRTVRALERVRVSIHSGEILAIVGESGSGKSTLGRLLAGVERPDEGEIFFTPQRATVPLDLSSLHGAELRRVRASVGLVFQDALASLDPRQHALASVAEVLRVHTRVGREASFAEGATRLARVGLSGTHHGRFPHELSGGERSRLCLARALAASPRALVLDEPTAALDVSIQAQIVELLLALRDEKRLGYALITHDIALARLIADRVVVLERGALVEEGAAERVLFAPVHAATRRLVSALEPMGDQSRSKERRLGRDV